MEGIYENYTIVKLCFPETLLRHNKVPFLMSMWQLWLQKISPLLHDKQLCGDQHVRTDIFVELSVFIGETKDYINMNVCKMDFTKCFVQIHSKQVCNNKNQYF